ncbi:pyridoxamine 5'-phosphate oxidase family protein [Geomonas sp.]|uniref:pyridoxamine 5'-phosphate oxidase family protein n=1 Tax=Geomonas sp. TaxID=2651584 RepID=UPI002B460507|nr:pyridoxamine 5'-phosphate oxidase family protein [Geomonas sp.]HJV36900.1 pyridoxamine 5'-phosphate oxidase family protein [Geomonas sp.]
MRRAEREVLETEFMHQVLHEADELFLAMNTGDAPYVLPVNHVLYKGDLFFHCATEGRKLELMKSDARVGFSTAVDIRVVGTTTRYRSVCGTGTASEVEDPVLKDEVLRAIAARFKAPCQFPVPPDVFARTGLVCIRIESLTGKHSREGEGPRAIKS